MLIITYSIQYLDQLTDINNPPEVPPRAQSLLASLRRHTGSIQRNKPDETTDLKHEEFIPQIQQSSGKYYKYKIMIDWVSTISADTYLLSLF